MTFPTSVVLEGDNAEVLSTLPSDSVHLVVTSPPYGSLRSYHGKPEWDFDALRKELWRVLVDGGAVAWVIGFKSSRAATSAFPKNTRWLFETTGG